MQRRPRGRRFDRRDSRDRDYGHRPYPPRSYQPHSYAPRPVRVPEIPASPAPVSVGDEREVTIEAVGRKGDGIAKVEGFTVFVAYGRVGERAKIRITDVRGSFAFAEKVQ